MKEFLDNSRKFINIRILNTLPNCDKSHHKVVNIK